MEEKGGVPGTESPKEGRAEDSCCPGSPSRIHLTRDSLPLLPIGARSVVALRFRPCVENDFSRTSLVCLFVFFPDMVQGQVRLRRELMLYARMRE